MNDKYRAWDKVKNIWIPGAYGFHILGESILIGGLFHDYKIENLNNIIITKSIGRKDINDKEIYQGDILEDNIPHLRLDGKMDLAHDIVIWSDAYLRWSIADYSKIEHSNPNFYNRKILGNIYENPELIESREYIKQDKREEWIKIPITHYFASTGNYKSKE